MAGHANDEFDKKKIINSQQVAGKRNRISIQRLDDELSNERITTQIYVKPHNFNFLSVLIPLNLVLS